ncbi:hypothetical protein EVAR_20969_1 [Eumeta japonica]|uniref:Uncharacterized protein n=1 Tax=Eumeta variegata TaxID=151549 RepID=A0A4C1V4W8_EUMVA|nr:hypothetical protein EVAR_20969_1 [Eumeta japonica]
MSGKQSDSHMLETENRSKGYEHRHLRFSEKCILSPSSQLPCKVSHSMCTERRQPALQPIRRNEQRNVCDLVPAETGGRAPRPRCDG